MFQSFPAAYLAPLCSMAVTFMLIAGMLRSRRLALPLDHPNYRSLHSAPVPRIGGVAIMAGLFTAFVLFLKDAYLPLALAGAIAMVSFVDDWRDLPASLRLLSHMAAAIVFVWLYIPDSPVVWWIVAVLAIVWMINLYNFMDGSDGLAGGMALFGFGAYGIAAWLAGDFSFMALNLTISGAAAAFLAFNFHPAKIFMGDAGSTPLGFLAAALGLAGWTKGYWPVWFPVLVFSPFVIDATVTLARRLFRGERIWQAHREHYYQRLIQAGCGHRNTALVEYAVMILAGVSGIWAAVQSLPVQLSVIAGWVVFYAIVMGWLDAYWKRHMSKHHDDIHSA